MADIIINDDPYGGSVSAGFPAGLKILIVDNNFSPFISLFQNCHYRVTTCHSGFEAVNALRKKNGDFDIVVSEFHLSDMEALKLLQIIRVEMDLPVIIMSDDYSPEKIMKVIYEGACTYWRKPLRKEEVSVIWQYVIPKRYSPRPSSPQRQPLSDMNIKSEDHQYRTNNMNNNNNINVNNGEENCGSSTFHMRNDDGKGSKNNHSIVSMKKHRMVWTQELHEKFVHAVNEIGIENAVPKKILEFMKDPRLTRENVASHLQKYRLYIKKLNENRKMKQLLSHPQYQQHQNINHVNHTPNIIHPCMIGSNSTSTSSHNHHHLQQQQQQQMIHYHPYPIQFQHSPASGVSQGEMEGYVEYDTEGLNVYHSGLNSKAVPVNYHQNPSVVSYMGNIDIGENQCSIEQCSLDATVQQQQQQQLLGGYNFCYDNDNYDLVGVADQSYYNHEPDLVE